MNIKYFKNSVKSDYDEIVFCSNKVLLDKYIKIGIFNKIDLYYANLQYNTLILTLKDSDYNIIIWGNNNFLWKRGVYWACYPNNNRLTSSFEEVFNSVNDEIRVKMIFNLDILNDKKNF